MSVWAPAGNLEANFEEMLVGQELGPVEMVVNEHEVKQFAFSVDDYSPMGARGEVDAAHAAILIPELLKLLNTRYDPSQEFALHQREEFWLHSLVRVGERVKLVAHFVDKYVKRDKGYIVTEGVAHSLEDGRLLARHRATEVARIDENVTLGGGSSRPPSRRVSCEYPADAEVASRATVETGAGVPLPEFRKSVEQDQIAVFSNIRAGWRSIHTDPEVARVVGLESPIAQGIMMAMYLSEALADFFGPSWGESGHMSLTFLAPVYPGDVLTCRSVTLGREENDLARLELEAWVENQDGKRVAVGWASSSLPALDEEVAK